MSTHTGEFAFEATVESMLLDGGWRKGDLGEWAVDRALFPARALAFICDTQPDLWAGMTTLHGASLESTLIETLVKELDNKGAMDVLRHGFRFYGKTFRLAYFKPSHGPQSGRARSVRAERPDRHAAGSVPSRERA